ncbi:phytoene desaturase family protein [Actinokineospora enzanensis]|uniref:phytoene desaturase family protein n=1 Tax=Actinokineospora enzanensis TaxID=155975 RepID=UPI00036B0094|nr:NAD(P)/FAD-dependent oxidoreductase [Actinokineospora enzanensis]
MNRHDVVVVGGGHNALVAAAYLARAGRSVLVVERLDRVGGAAVSASPFPGVRLSRYSYLVSLLPDRIVADLGLRLTLRSRSVSSYTPIVRDGVHTGLLVGDEAETTASFRALTGSDAEYARWREFYAGISRMAVALAPTLLEPLPTKESVRDLVVSAAGRTVWRQVFEQPLSETLTTTFTDDVVRGVVATDGLIGTHASLTDMRANRCFLYHVIGNGTGEWRVPVGGMGAVTAELTRAAREAGAHIVTGAEVVRVDVDGKTAQVIYRAGDEEVAVDAGYVLSGVAPAVLDRVRGRVGTPPVGAQLKVNVLLDRLPRLRSGISPEQAFAGTFHLDESYTELEEAYRLSAAGSLPERPPGEMYCHTLTDRSIVDSPTAHTLTLFGLHLPDTLFTDNDATRDELVRRYLAGLDRHLLDPIADCLATIDGRPCVEARTPRDLEAELAMPGGNIFHGDLAWPFGDGGWGVETDVPNLLVCGSGARRGGGVSGIAGHNAAMAVLARPV